jgi:hypothetical protein
MSVAHNWSEFAWVHEPTDWAISPTQQLRWSTRPNSDFWRNTAGAEGADDGDAFLRTCSGDFNVTMTLESGFADQYDQCGLMVRADERHWLKAGIERDGATWLSVVATHENSDWSKQEWLNSRVVFTVWRSGNTLRIGFVDERGTHLVRELIFDGDVMVGPYSCAPKGPGFTVTVTSSFNSEGEWTFNAQAGPAAS